MARLLAQERLQFLLLAKLCCRHLQRLLEVAVRFQEMQLGPVHLLCVFGKSAGNIILNFGFANETGISGEIAPAGPQFVLEAAVLGSFGSKLQRKETHIPR